MKIKITITNILINLFKKFLLPISIFYLSLLVFASLDKTFYLTSIQRLISLIFSSVILILLICKIKIENVVFYLEEKFPFKGLLFSALKKYDAKYKYSEEMISEIKCKAKELLREVNFLNIFLKRIWKTLPVISIAIFFFFTYKINNIIRILKPFLKEERILLYPGDFYCEIGDSVEIYAKPVDFSPDYIYLHLPHEIVKLKKEKKYKVIVGPIVDSLEYYAYYKDVKSKIYKIRLKVPPYITSLKIILDFPDYTGIKNYVTSEPNITALRGTKVNFYAKCNTPLKQVKFKFKKGGHLKNIKIKDNEFTANFKVMQSDTYFIKLISVTELENVFMYHINVIKDDSPKVTITYPAHDKKLDESMRVLISFKAEDDFGLSKALFISDLDTFTFYFKREPKDTFITFLWDLSQKNLLPGDKVYYYVKVLDNDAVMGEKPGFSQRYKVYFPSLAEMYKEVEEEGAKVEETLKEIQNLIESAEKSTKGDVSEALSKAKKLLKELEKATKEYNELTEEMEKNPFIDEELARQIKELQDLMEELMTEEMRQALQRLTEALKKHPRKLAEALRNLNLSYENLKKSIKRTLHLLKLYKKELKLKRFAEKAKELAEAQKSLTQRMRKENPQDLKKLQSGILQKMKDLKSEIDKLEGFEEEKKLSAQILKDMERLEKMMGEGKASPKLSRKIANDLEKLSERFNVAFKNFLAKTKEPIFKDFKDLLQYLLFVSFEIDSIGMDLESAYRLQALIDGMKLVKIRVDAILMETPFIRGKFEENIKNAINAMENMKRAIEEQKEWQFKFEKKRSKSEIVKSIKKILDELNRLQTQSFASMMQSLFDKLSQMIKNQEDLMKMAQSILPLPLSNPLTQQQLQSLIQKQMELAQSLKKLAQEIKEKGGSNLGDELGEIAEEMEKLADDMKKGLTEDIIKRQKRLLDKMLEARKSVYKKKITRKRYSEPGKDFTDLKSPPVPKLITKRGVDQEKVIAESKKKIPKYLEKARKEYFEEILTQ